MCESYCKRYTILFYANGNNEFMPEMDRLKQFLQLTASNNDINIVIQLGMIKQEIIKIIRPTYPAIDTHIDDPGVKRYYISDEEAVLVEDLGNANMADPKCLSDFVLWGMENYPSEQYILVMGGHIYQFVGLNFDYTQEYPYIMGIPEMCTALKQTFNITKKKIDLLVLDTCHINCIEVLYEFGNESPAFVQSILTYIQSGPFTGLPYNVLIDSIKKHCRTLNLTSIVREFIDGRNLNIIYFDVQPSKLDIFPKLFNNIAYSYLDNSDGLSMDPTELFSQCDPKYPWYPPVLEVYRNIGEIVIHYKQFPVKKNGLLTFAQRYFDDANKLLLYKKLAFARDNCWTKLLSSKLEIDAKDTYPKIQPVPMVFLTR